MPEDLENNVKNECAQARTACEIYEIYRNALTRLCHLVFILLRIFLKI